MAILAQWLPLWKRPVTLRAVDEDAGATAETVATLDSARQEKAHRYARQRQRLMLLNLGVSAVVIAILLFSGLSFWLRDALHFAAGWQPIAGWEPVRTALYFLVLGAAVAIIDAPLSWYGGYVLPRRYGISTQRFGGWILDGLKSLAISLPIEILAVLFVYLLLAVSPNAWWLWTGLAILLFTVVVANLAPILLLPLFYKLTPLPDGDVKQRALALAAGPYACAWHLCDEHERQDHGGQRGGDGAGQHATHRDWRYAAQPLHTRRNRGRRRA